ISMDGWIDKVSAVLEIWYPGMLGGRAVANILFGDQNPSGKLPVTFPRSLSDSPAHKSKKTYPGENLKVHYDEGIFVGYRYFEKMGIDPLFPFGFGLSYTTFTYNDVICDKKALTTIDDMINLGVTITNIGNRSGKEIVQVYARNQTSEITRPVKELVGFTKIYLEPKETKTAVIIVKAKDLTYYDDKSHTFVLESGDYNLLIGSSSKEIFLQSVISVPTTVSIK
ncbi:MAG: glycoside hydrolase family 3 C-terminal domain-containing protein, partial [Candidatus Thorarchaeota archaeon]